MVDDVALDIETPALKEWAVIVRALLAGEQILDLRKGGLREADRRFAVRAHRFWWYPTIEHQKPELLAPAYRHWIDESVAAAPPDGSIRIEGWAEVVATTTITTDDELHAIDSKLVWTPSYAAHRLHWKHRNPLWVLALRVHVLDEPIDIDWNESYAGCTSWVEIADLPSDPAAVPSSPALSDTAFDARLSSVREALPSLR